MISASCIVKADCPGTLFIASVAKPLGEPLSLLQDHASKTKRVPVNERSNLFGISALNTS